MNFLASGQTPRRLGNAHPNIAPYQTFAAEDGHLIIAVGNDGQFAKLCCELGLSARLEDGRFANNDARVEHRGELACLLSPAIRARKSAEMLDRLAEDRKSTRLNSSH